MNKKFSAAVSIFLLTILLGACQQRMFGVDEAVWNALSEPEREKVIDGYNKRKEIELGNAQKQKEKELENERHRQEVEAQTAPIYATADVLTSILGKSTKQERSVRIESISSNMGHKMLTIGGDQFEVSVFSGMSQAWVKGQKVELTANKNDHLYPIKIKNLENGETVNAKKHY